VTGDGTASAGSGATTTAVGLVDRLASLPNLSRVPREELVWLVEHGTVRVFEPGVVVGPEGEPIETLWVIVSGLLSVRVDRGTGPRRVIEWTPGELSGMLPYSRMTAPPGDNVVERRAELLMVHEDLFPEMIHHCPTVTAQAVHLMIDRARSFNSSDLHDEKMASLGRLAAGLAHELNNPAAATVRAAKLLPTSLADGQAAARAVAEARLSPDQLSAIEEMFTVVLSRPEPELSALERADREDEIVGWLESHDASLVCASTITDTALGMGDLEELAEILPGPALDVALRWLSSQRLARSLAEDIERSADRISGLVGAIKRFTYMDQAAAPGAVEVEPGLRDTLGVLAAKARSKKVSVALDLPEDLPLVRANGAELNQVWLNLLDNALDACPESGHVEIRGETTPYGVVVRVIDDGRGIPEEIRARVFEPFVTTKAPGQGTGLGLDIARRLARSFHADISVESRPGRTEFAVTLVADAS
jgi:signal transduction histidine kinase